MPFSDLFIFGAKVLERIGEPRYQLNREAVVFCRYGF